MMLKVHLKQLHSKRQLQKQGSDFAQISTRAKTCRDEQGEFYSMAKQYKVKGDVDSSFDYLGWSLGAKDYLKKVVSRKKMADMLVVSIPVFSPL